MSQKILNFTPPQRTVASIAPPAPEQPLRCRMLNKSLFTLAFLCAALGAQAQSTPAKADLAGRIVKLQQPAIESMARAMAEQPAAEMMDRAGATLPVRVAPDKREAVGREIQSDVKKYLDEAVPLVRDRAIKLAPSTIGVLLEEKFTEDELRQVLAVMESPAWLKFQQLGGDMQKVLQEKLIADTRGNIEPKLMALEQSMAKRLGVTEPAAAKPAAKAGKPAAK